MKRRFTLFELLVFITVIAVLITMESHLDFLG